VLADKDGELDALRFSLASDIVELVVLTRDEAFLQTLREAVGSSRRLWHVPSADKVSDLLVAGEVGILVLDVPSLNEAPTVFITQIKRQFPDMVIVVAGNRDSETTLAGLISAGAVYRFIHKPMSPGRAKLFADAAVKRYEEQRSRRAAAIPLGTRRSRSNRAVVVGGALGVLAAVAVGAAIWMLQKSPPINNGAPRAVAAARPAVAESPQLANAAAALAANRLTEPAGDNALELYLQAQARNPADPIARAGLAEVHERLLAKAENALLEERLDEAAIAIETARKSGVEGGRIAFLTAQLAKSREQLKSTQAARSHSDVKPDADKVTPLLTLAAQRLKEARVIDPERDSALFYIKEARRLDPGSDAAQDAEKALAMRLLSEAHGAIDRREFSHASAWLASARGVASAANIEAAEGLLATARRQADADAWTQLLKNAEERLQQDRLIEPSNDSAKYYLLTLRGLDPNNPSLGAALQDLGTRLVAKARRALALEQYEAARSWLDEAAATGFASAESNTLRDDLDTAVAAQQFLANVIGASELTLIKSVKPDYPQKANAGKIEGWVELDFSVAENGEVKDIAVHAASAPGVFDASAINALKKWRYKPVMRDSKAVPQRARIRIRFALAD
jgi:TonB family protein